MTAASQFLRAGTSLLWRGAILFVLIAGSIVLVSRVGRLVGTGSDGKTATAAPRDVEAAAPIDWSQVDAAVVEAADTARQHAEQYADGELDGWTKQMLDRVDRDFLPWYFGYWNQQGMGLQACWQGLKYQVAGYITDSDTPSPTEQMALDIQAEFANRVLRPESAQLHLERITQQAVEVYVGDLRERLADIQVRYQIAPRAWEEYLEGIGTSVQRVDGNRQVPLSLKAVTASTAGGAAILARSLVGLAARTQVRLAAGAAQKPIAQMAAGAGAKVAARAGSKMLGPAIAVGVIAWDVWDHHRTVTENQPILRDALAEYLWLQKESLLRDPQTGVLGTIHQVEAGIVRSLDHGQLTDCQPRP
jgi:hypothetical protein